MSKIHITNFINAPVERVFNLSRNLALSKLALKGRQEHILSSSGNNLVAAGETITIRAKHLGKTREITARVTDLKLAGRIYGRTSEGRPEEFPARISFQESG